MKVLICLAPNVSNINLSHVSLRDPIDSINWNHKLQNAITFESMLILTFCRKHLVFLMKFFSSTWIFWPFYFIKAFITKESSQSNFLTVLWCFYSYEKELNISMSIFCSFVLQRFLKNEYLKLYFIIDKALGSMSTLLVIWC